MINKPTVIYADDSIETLRLIEIAAGDDKRFELEFVTSGEDLMSRVQTKTYSAALIDLNLGMALSGTILAEKIHMLYPKMPIVIYTGYDTTRVERILKDSQINSAIIQIWTKDESDVDTIADKIADLVEDSDAVQK